MPLYEYECEVCGRRFELIQKFSDPPAHTCELCGGAPVRRLLSSPAIQFKGAGWYITDYARSGGGAKEPAAAKSDSAPASSDTPSAPAAAPKPEGKD